MESEFSGHSKLFEKKFSIVREITSAIAAVSNMSTVANLMLDLAMNYTGAEKGSLMLINEREELYILAARGIDIQLMGTYRTSIGEGIVGIVARDRKAVLVEDIRKDKRFKDMTRDRYKTTSFISCPIMSKKRLLGVLNINDKADGTPFTEDEFALIGVIADQAAVAFENAYLMNQLRLKAAEMEEINRKLIETDVAKTETLTNISHELRTPLNSIKGAVHHVGSAEGLSPAEQKEFYGIISDEVDKLISVVENLLNFLRYEDEARTIKKSLLNPGELLKEIAGSQTFKGVLAKKNLKLDLRLKPGVSDIVADKTKVVQLFVNLTAGLGQYLEAGDTLTIDLSENDIVEVTLTIPRRLPETAIPYLFSSGRMFQADRQDEGLKLYLARKVAEVHRWSIRSGNVDGSFQVTLGIPKSTREKTEAVVNTSMDMFVEFISDLMGLNTCSIMLSDELTDELVIKSAKGLDEEVVKRTRIKPGDRIAGWVALEGKPLLIEDIEADPRFGRKNVPHYSTKSFLSLPLKAGGKVVGVLNLNNKTNGRPFTAMDLDVAQILGERVSRFVERLYGGQYGGEEFKRFVSSFHDLLDAEKRYGAKIPFPDLMVGTMKRLGAEEEEAKLALYVSMIYDLGLVLVDESILGKKELSPSEVHTLKVHPHTTVDLLGIFEYSEEVKRAILHHHEHYDGTGYPERLKGEEIPLISRVLAVVDAYCAMTSDRPYRKRLTRNKALEEIREQAGLVYDPRVVEAFEEVLTPGHEH
jgi:GAF domain-containing protein